MILEFMEQVRGEIACVVPLPEEPEFLLTEPAGAPLIPWLSILAKIAIGMAFEPCTLIPIT